MSDPTVRGSVTILVHQEGELPKVATYIGECCREWVLALFVPVGRCGICGERPTYKREDDGT